MTNRQTYIDTMKAELDKLDAKMTRVEAKAAEAKAEARDKYQEEMGKLRAQSKLAAAKLEELKLAGETTWDKMTAEMEKVRDAFTHSFNYFKAQF